jgi:serine/threonine-protein kinase
MLCPDDAILLDAAEGRRALDALTEAHLGVCDDCRRVLAAAARGAGDTLRGRDLSPPPTDEPSWDELGSGVTVGGRFTLDRFLGAGGMGIVWSAVRDDGVRVAIKIPRSTDRDTQRRSEREAQIGELLVHPSIVRTLAVIPAARDRGACLVQELLEGESLAARLERDRTLALGDAATILVSVARAVSRAHECGVVHRDLKPQNVFLAGSRVVVLDFGIAKLLEEWGVHSKLTRTGAVVGSLLYMAPEQLFGEADIDGRADVWAMGVLLFQMLVGRPPVLAASLGEVVRAMRSGHLEDLGAHTQGLPDGVLELVRAALVIPREGRLRDIGQFERVLAPYGQ